MRRHNLIELGLGAAVSTATIVGVVKHREVQNFVEETFQILPTETSKGNYIPAVLIISLIVFFACICARSISKNL